MPKGSGKAAAYRDSLTPEQEVWRFGSGLPEVWRPDALKRIRLSAFVPLPSSLACGTPR